MNYLRFCLALTAVYGALFVFADFHDIPCNDVRDFMLLAMQFVAIETGVFGLLCLIGISRRVFAALFPLLTLVCTVLAYFRYTANVTLIPITVDLALTNDAATSMDVVTWQLVALVLLSVAAAVWTAVYRYRRVTIRRRAAWLVAGALLTVAPVGYSRTRNAVGTRIPFSVYTSVEGYLESRREAEAVRPMFNGKAVCGSDSLTVVFVLGESLRAANLQINGYGRATTPLLCRERNAVSLPNVYTDYTLTHLSIPHMLTRSDERNPDRAYPERSFISLLRQASYRTAWLSNQEQVSTFAYFMNEGDTLVYVNGEKSAYNLEKWLDGDLLPEYDKELARGCARQFILLHTIGSHWWYNSHYPDSLERFRPVIDSRVISAKTAEEMRNSYDNTIVYSDYVWHSLINRLRGRNAVLLYLSDHAESLGEDGYFIHGTDRPEVRRPACFVWYSDEFARRYPDKVAALRANKNKQWKTYMLFHSVLSAADVESAYIDPRLDIFYNARQTR